MHFTKLSQKLQILLHSMFWRKKLKEINRSSQWHIFISTQLNFRERKCSNLFLHNKECVGTFFGEFTTNKIMLMTIGCQMSSFKPPGKRDGIRRGYSKGEGVLWTNSNSKSLNLAKFSCVCVRGRGVALAALALVHYICRVTHVSLSCTPPWCTCACQQKQWFCTGISISCKSDI